MRNWTALLLALIITLSGVLVLPTNAQTAVADRPPTHVAEDGVGDVMINENDQNQPAPSGRFGPSDLKGLDITETAEKFIFTLFVQSLKPDPAEIPGTESGTYSVMFRNHDRDFRLQINRQYFAGANYFAQLQAFDPGRNGYFTITSNPADIEVTEDVATGAIIATIVHRDLLADGFGAAPHPEVPFTGFRVTSRAINTNFNLGRGPAGNQKIATPYAWDAMPNEGNSTLNGGVMPIYHGVLQSGQARLKAVIPSRASNGEATTFVFEVEAFNLGKSEDRFNLLATGVPSAWSVKLPAAQITIPGNGTLRFPVLVTTPFAHDHGVYKSFLIEMTSLSESSSVGRLQLGVRYVNPPQPAGHHAQVWIHSTAPSADPTAIAFQTLFPGENGLDATLYMNALKDDTVNDMKKPVPASMDCMDTPAFNCENDVPGDAAPPKVHYIWEIPLSPGLDMGLDFDTKGNGELKTVQPMIDVKVRSTLPMTGAVFGGTLVYYAAPEPGQQNQFGFAEVGNRTVIAYLDETTPVDVGAQATSTTFTTILHVTPGGEFIPFKKGASLTLFLTLNFTRSDAPFGPRDAPLLLPEGTLTLPLVEYHDPVEAIFLSTVELVATSKADRFINPGKAVLFNITLVNHGDREDTFLVEMTGTHAADAQDPWANLIMANPQVTLAAGGSTALAVAVRAPANAVRPDAADLVITATSQTDFNQRSLLHLYAIVDTDNVFADESGWIEELEEQAGSSTATPGLELFAILAALGACALLLRRRPA